MSSRATAATASSFALVLAAGAALFAACVEPPPKIAAIPTSGLSLRVHVFGASALDARQAFDAAKQTNENLRIVREGGDGEVLVGLENDSPKCVAPTALCSFKVAMRVRDNAGNVVHAATTTVSANAERCSDLCEKALNQMVVKVLEAAAAALKGHASVESDASTADSLDAGAVEVAEAADAASPPAPGSAQTTTSPKPPVKKASRPAGSASAKPEPPAKAEPAMCVVAHGPPLPTEEAEKRAAQVEVLKRIDVLDQEEYDCLRKAYLERL